MILRTQKKIGGDWEDKGPLRKGGLKIWLINILQLWHAPSVTAVNDPFRRGNLHTTKMRNFGKLGDIIRTGTTVKFWADSVIWGVAGWNTSIVHKCRKRRGLEAEFKPCPCVLSYAQPLPRQHPNYLINSPALYFDSNCSQLHSFDSPCQGLSGAPIFVGFEAIFIVFRRFC